MGDMGDVILEVLFQVLPTWYDELIFCSLLDCPTVREKPLKYMSMLGPLGLNSGVWELLPRPYRYPGIL